MIPRFPKGFSHPVQIGAGGYGSVYRARQDALNRLVALKFITEKNAQARAALMKEASMQAGLRIRGIPQVYDVKEIAGRVCLVMEWIKGCSLRVLLERGLPDRQKHVVISEIIAVIAHLHEREFAHRDIKPENIIVSDGGVFIVDFGLALHVFKDVRQTMTNVVKGTPEYIAPELWKGRGCAADLKRADIYSMGKVIQEITGAEHLPECILQCLEIAPERRPSSAVEIARGWESAEKPSAITWSEVSEPFASEILAKQLHSSAQALLRMERRAEAYDLLVECLQTLPEFPDALDLMGRFPMIKRRMPVLVKYKFAFIVPLFILLCFFSASVLLKSAIKDDVASKQTYSRSLFMSASDGRTDGIDRSLPFKEEAWPRRFFGGNLVIASHPGNGSLFIDGNRVPDVSGTIRLSASAADHGVVWRSDKGAVAWKEIIRVLPFETKRICIKER